MSSKHIFQACLLALMTTIFTNSIEARNLQNDRLQDHDRKVLLRNNQSPKQQVPFNLEEIYKRKFSAIPFDGVWISSNEILYDDSLSGDIIKFNVQTDQSTVIVNGSVLTKYGPDYAYELSPDHNHLLIGYSPQIQFRHSRLRKFAVYNLETKTAEKIADGEDLLLAEWSTVGNSLIYEHNNDLYYREVAGNGTCVTRRLSTDGVPGTIYNGVLDWVYEEEVMSTGSATWFSPDGNYLVFASLNDTEVKTMSYFYYGEPGDLNFQYPEEVFIKYPKAGTKNPDVALFLVDLRDPNSRPIHLETPIDVVGTDHILFTVEWLKNETVAAIWTNRVQNVGELVSYDTKGKMNKLLNLAEDKGWLDVPDRILIHEETIFIIKKQETHTEEGKYEHVTSYHLVNGTLTNETDLTPFHFSVQSLLEIDSKNGIIYYLASAPGEPSQRNLYSLRVADGNVERPNCISCSLLTPEGNNCTYASAVFSEDASNYVLVCFGPDPLTADVYNREHIKTHSWQTNQRLREKLKERLSVSMKTVNINVNGFTSRARMILPPGFDETRKYPMIVQVYAGPNTAAIKDVASYSYNFYYVTNRSVIWTVIDGRGSAYRGSELLFQIYRRLGSVEIEDQIAVTKELHRMYRWIDSNRTGIWGWSYGGFAAAMALATDNETVFKCGISVAPVSSWIYYDSIYTERFMGLPTPEDNLDGYNRSDVTNYVEGIRGKKYMLIHGTGDDNVHYQQSMALAKSLAIADIPFEQISYPDEAHSLSGVTPHLAHTMDHFWADCLELSSYPEKP